MHQIIDKIMKAQADLPAAQRLVAAYVVDNCYQIPFLSITALAKNVGVSETTVIKFCSQLGFGGFGEFKKMFSESVHSELVMYNKISGDEPEEPAGDTIFARVCEEATSNVQATMASTLNAESLERVMPMMAKAKRLYTIGGRSSDFLSEFLAHTLRYLGLPVQAVSGGISDLYDKTSLITPDDLVVAICFQRYTALTIELLQELHEREVPIVLITDTGLSPAYPYADLVFHCTLTSDGYFPCYASYMALCSVIFRTASSYFKESASTHIRTLEQKLLERGVFI